MSALAAEAKATIWRKELQFHEFSGCNHSHQKRLDDKMRSNEAAAENLKISRKLCIDKRSDTRDSRLATWMCQLAHCCKCTQMMWSLQPSSVWQSCQLQCFVLFVLFFCFVFSIFSWLSTWRWSHSAMQGTNCLNSCISASSCREILGSLTASTLFDNSAAADLASGTLQSWTFVSWSMLSHFHSSACGWET